MAVYHNLQTVFVEIAKNASTSLRNILSGGQDMYSDHVPYMWMKEIEEFNGNDISGYYKFVITRNPYDRFISAYEALVTQQQLEDTPDDMLDWLLEKVSRVTGEPIKILDENGDPIPGVYEKPLAGPLEYWWQDAPPTFWPQHAFISEGETVYVTEYFKIEELETSWSSIRNSIQSISGEVLPETLPVMNTRTNPSDWKSFFEGAEGQSRANKIEQLYGKDFTMFNYETLSFE